MGRLSLWLLLVALLWIALLANSVNGQRCIQRFDKPDNYSELAPPSRPTVVQVLFGLMAVKNVNQKEKTFRVELWIVMEWTDQRLSGFHPVNGNCSKITLVFEGRLNIWHPNFDFHSTNADIYNAMLENDKTIFEIDKTGNIKVASLVDATFQCPMIFNNYPYDRFACNITIDNLHYTYDDLVLRSSLRTSSKFDSKSNNGDSPFYLDAKKIPNGINPYFNSSTSGITINMSRIIKPYITSAYFPSVLFMLATLISFLIPPENIPGRMALLVTTLLMFINMSGDARAQSPLTSGTMIHRRSFQFRFHFSQFGAL